MVCAVHWHWPHLPRDVLYSLSKICDKRSYCGLEGTNQTHQINAQHFHATTECTKFTYHYQVGCADEAEGETAK